MSRDLRSYLWDIQQASEEILQFTRNKTFVDYESDGMMRAAVERKFEIIGEAIAQIARSSPEKVADLNHYRRFIGFRNILIHQSATIVNEIVWNTIETDLPTVRAVFL